MSIAELDDDELSQVAGGKHLPIPPQRPWPPRCQPGGPDVPPPGSIRGPDLPMDPGVGGA